jgi:hypothetical protein
MYVMHTCVRMTAVRTCMYACAHVNAMPVSMNACMRMHVMRTCVLCMCLHVQYRYVCMRVCMYMNAPEMYVCMHACI